MMRFRRLAPEQAYYLLSAGQSFLSATMFTVYTVYFVQAVGLQPLQLVLVGTTLEATALVFEVPTGVIADAFSRRLSVVLGMFLLGVSFLVTGAVPRFAAVLLAQVISGIGYTCLSGALEAWLADEVGAEQVGRVMLRAGQVQRLAGLAGVGASVALASLRLNLPYLAGGAGFVVLGVALALGMPEHSFAPRPADDRGAWQSMWRIAGEGARIMRGTPVLALLAGVQLFAGAASEGYDRLGDAHLLANFVFPAPGALTPLAWFGVIRVASSLLGLGATEALRPRLERLSRSPAAAARLLLVLNALIMLSVLVFARAGSFPLALAALLAKSAVEALAGPLYMAWLVQHVAGPARATVLSMVSQSNALGQVAGGPGVGWIGSRFSLRAAIAATGVLLAPAVALYASRVPARPGNQSGSGFHQPKPDKTCPYT